MSTEREEALRRALERTREALQFFADGGSYEARGGWQTVDWPLQVIAREALASTPVEPERPRKRIPDHDPNACDYKRPPW